MQPKVSKLVANKIGELLGPVEIAKGLNVTTAEAIHHLFIAIGEELMRESDLYFILAKKYKDESGQLDSWSGLPPRNLRAALKIIYFEAPTGTYPETYDLDELMLYASYRKRRVYIGDMYLFLTELERTLHHKIKCGLEQKFGKKELGWWKAGVPDTVRINCAQAREFDDESIDHPYCFSTFIHLKKIIDKNWLLFISWLPQSVIGDKTAFLKQIVRLNDIRNQVMHPVRGEPPTESDFEFVRELHKKLDVSLWKK